MAQMYNIDDLSYTPSENPEWFTRAMYGGRLIDSGIIRVLQGIKGGEKLNMIDLENKVLQIDGMDCAWTPNQIIKMSEKEARVTTYKINLEECIDKLETKRTNHMLSPGAENDTLPPELETATLALIAISLSNEIEEMIFGGDSDEDPNQFDGMEKILLDSPEAAKIVGAVLTVNNIIGAVEAAYDAVTDDVLQAEDAGTLYLFGSYKNRRLLKKALDAAKLPNSNQVISVAWDVDATDKKNPRIYFNGLEYVAVKGIGKNTLIILDTRNNAFLLTDLESDLDKIELGQFPKPNENKVWIKGRLRLGFIIPFEGEAVIWSDKITAAQAPYEPANELRVVPNSLVFKAVGETKIATVITTDTAATLDAFAPLVPGFSIVRDATVAGVTTLHITSTDNRNNPNVRTGEINIKITGKNRGVTLTLNQDESDVAGEVA
jgi:hypothetical protein